MLASTGLSPGMAALLLLLATLVIGLHLWASAVVLRDDGSSRSRRGAQLAVVWLLPLVGPLLALAALRQPERPTRRYREGPPDPGEDYGLSAMSGRRLPDAVDGD